MTQTQVRKIEEKIDRLEKKLDFVIHHYFQTDNDEKDWIDDPKVVAYLEKLVDEAKNEKLYTTEEVFN